MFRISIPVPEGSDKPGQDRTKECLWSDAKTTLMFDQKYYEEIWGTVHRHDYCESLADSLIAKYGKARFLDIGTGCGELVRVLREKGAEAIGIDASEYAVANSHGNVILGDVRNLPFKNKEFDVVFSQGLWGYFPEEDVATAWNECLRVGKFQEHNYDFDDNDPTHKYVIVRSREWWEERLVVPKILVTCPTHQVKEYCFQEWIDNVKNLTYPNYDILVVDNSPDDSYVKKWGSQVPMIHLPNQDQDPQRMGNRICNSMAVAQKHFLEGNYTHWMNIEADNIPPKNVIEVLLKYGKDADWISHCYHALPEHDTVQQGIGCSLLSRKLMADFDWSKADDTPDSELWNFAKPKMRESDKYKTVELWGIMDVKHRK